MCVSHQLVFLSAYQPMWVSRGTLASVVAGQLVIYISRKYVLKHLSIITQLQLKAPTNVLPPWEQAIFTLAGIVFVCVYVQYACVLGGIGQLAGCGLQRWR